MLITINSVDGGVIYEGEHTTFGEAFQEAASRGPVFHADLSGRDLAGLGLHRVDLGRACLRGSDLRNTDLSRAVLFGANLSGADLRGARFIGADLYEADFRGAQLGGSDFTDAKLWGARFEASALRGVGGFPEIPVVPDIDARMLEVVGPAGEFLYMGTWHHECGTKHCRAGWAVVLAGEAGRKLEERCGPLIAGTLIYEASRPGVPAPGFFAEDKQALVDIKACAAAARV